MDINIIRWVVRIVLGFVAVLVLFSLWDARDAVQAASAQQYEECVRNTYHMSPQAYLAEHGSYPDCAF